MSVFVLNRGNNSAARELPEGVRSLTGDVSDDESLLAALGNQQRGRNAVELCGRAMLELAVGRDLSLQRHHFFCVVFGTAQHVDADGTDRDEEDDN